MDRTERIAETEQRMAEPLKDGEDYYLERGFLVFTEDFLKRRGYCCEAGCRHCPWGFPTRRRTDESDETERDEV